MRIPKKVSPSPILEAVTEIRFENEVASAVLFGKLYGALADEFGQTEQLPILEMPAPFRDSQPEFRYAPHFRLKNDDFIVNIGQRTISVNRVCTVNEYDGWDRYYEVIQRVFEKVATLGIVESASRTSIRYINFFEQSAQEVLNLELGMFGQRIEDHNELVMSFYRQVSDETKLLVNLGTKATVQLADGAKSGLVLNLEAYLDTDTNIGDVSTKVVSLHKVVEENFFKSLNTNYLESLNPVYE